MADTFDLRAVSKFNGQNFQVWKFQMKTIFAANEITAIVYGTEVKPENTQANADAIKLWIKKDAKAMYIISSSLEHSQLECLLTCSSSREMWTKISGIHEQKSASNKLALTTRFHEYRMAPNDSMAQHVSKIENLANQLKDINEPVSDTMILAKILSTLPMKFNAFVSAWDSVDAANQTLANLRERLLREESRMTNMDDLTSALATTSISRQSNKEDHNGGPNSTKNKKVIVCRYCNKKNHIEKYCYQKKRDTKSGKLNCERDSASNKERSSIQDSGASVAFVASSGPSRRGLDILAVGNCLHDFTEAPEAESWILDSGASRHVCCRREWFSEFTPCGNEFVYLGDGSEHEIRGVGNVFIERFLSDKFYDSVINNVLYVPTLQKNLLSTGVCMQLGQKIQLSGKSEEIFSKDGILIAKGIRQRNNLMRLLFKSRVDCVVNYTSAAPLKSWHERLGHVNVNRIKAMLRNDSITGVTLTNKDDFFCSACPLGK